MKCYFNTEQFFNISIYSCNIDPSKMYCFNCRETTNHKAAQCPQHQMYTRCPTCNAVASTTSGHKEWCTTKEFQSRYIGGSSVVFEMTFYALNLRWSRIYSPSLMHTVKWKLVRLHCGFH